jgi:hypothetical protein
MGFSFKNNMLEIKEALRAIDPAIYLYGEGCDFGSQVAPELSGHLSREGAPTGIVISRGEHKDNGRRTARIAAEVEKLLGLVPESEAAVQGEQE